MNPKAREREKERERGGGVIQKWVKCRDQGRRCKTTSLQVWDVSDSEGGSDDPTTVN